MDPCEEIASATMDLVEEAYPQFLDDMSLGADTFLTRVVYYKAMLMVIKEEPLDDDRINAIVIGRLTMLHDAAQGNLFELIRRNLKR